MKEFNILIIDCNTRHYRDISLLIANYLKNFSVEISPPTEKLFEEFSLDIYIFNEFHQAFSDMESMQDNTQKILRDKYDLIVLARDISGDGRDHEEITGFDFFQKFIQDTTVPILGIYSENSFRCSECKVLDNNFRKNLLTLKNPVEFINERFIEVDRNLCGNWAIYNESKLVASFSYNNQKHFKPVLEKLLSVKLDSLPERNSI